MFMSLQGFLPAIDLEGEVTWKLRERGHPGNWTRENVDYCLEAVLKIILQIQHALFRPHAIPFRYVFEDVLTANRDGVLVNAEEGGIFGLTPDERPRRKIFCELKKGQAISGHLIPAFEFDPPSKWEETHLESANLFVISGPKADIPGQIGPHTLLLVRPDLVEISYRVVDYPEARERYPHLFDQQTGS
jgi:hypothetical protein